VNQTNVTQEGGCRCGQVRIKMTVPPGEPVVGGLHGTTRHFFCPHCMSWMFTRADGFDFVNVRATMLDDPSGFSPFIETYTSEKLAWAATPAPHKFEKFPALEEYKGLMEKYVQWAEKPKQGSPVLPGVS
jgi:hypothetical protein